MKHISSSLILLACIHTQPYVPKNKPTGSIIYKVPLHRTHVTKAFTFTQTRQTAIIIFNSQSFKNLHAVLNNAQHLNLRFTQISLPNGTFDGPFGPTLYCTLNQKGVYTLRITKNNMASGRATGSFSVSLYFKK